MYKKIMVPLDGSELAECVLPHVDAFISGCQVGSIVFVRVIDPTPLAVRGSYVTSKEDLDRLEASSKRVEDERKSAAEQYLKQIAGRVQTDRVEIKTEVVVGKVADSLVDYAEDNQIDLILIATHGRSGVSRWVRGSIADRVLRAAKVPVLMVRAPGAPREK